MLNYLARSFLFLLPPECAHGVTIRVLASPWWLKNAKFQVPQSLSQTLFGCTFNHPLGLAAGFDKDGIALSGLFKLGLSSVEIGSVTPRPQSGNPRPRLFRLKADQAIINRLGFNNQGIEAMADQFTRHAYHQKPTRPIIGINLGKNKDSLSESDDFVTGAMKLVPFCDYMTINISSPNTKGLRDLQTQAHVKSILEAVRDATKKTKEVPLLIKLAPDLEPDHCLAIADLLKTHKLSDNPLADGIIMGNTTLSRPDLKSTHLAQEIGGLSGTPLEALALQKLSLLYRHLKGEIPLIGCGGINSPEAAYKRIRAGANLLQLYTALIYQGPVLIRQIVEGLAAYLERDGLTHISQLVGTEHS